MNGAIVSVWVVEMLIQGDGVVQSLLIADSPLLFKHGQLVIEEFTRF
jgi:hypothetical protein